MKSASLNHVYRIVWNAALGVWQTASEVTRGRGKTKASKQLRLARRQAAALAALGALGGLGALPAFAADLPTGGVVVAGSAAIAQAGTALNINQASDRAAIDWQSFSVGQGHSVNFQQPSSSAVALNRVLGNDVSVIQGAINANGQVFLVNQNGVLFTPTAQVNVGGIVASTRNISTADFMAGRHTFSGDSAGTVENRGDIKAGAGGTVALIAAKVINSGSITAPQGTVGLAAGNTVVVDLGGPVKIQVTEGALNAAIEQSGGIRADGGAVYLTAKAAGDLAASVINHAGVTQALSMAALTGAVDMTASVINHSGTADVSGDISGGAVALTATTIADSGVTRADGGETGGRIVQHATGDLTQGAGAKLSANGGETGGHVELFAGHGGDWGGGTGGSGEGHGVYAGQIYATGRRRGGFIETSGRIVKLNENTLQVNAGSSEGKAGTWLIDPNDYTIAATGGDVTGAFLASQLANQDVTISTATQGTAGGNGDIHVNDSISAPGTDKTLTLKAERNINVNKAVSVDGLNLTAVGSVNVNSVVTVGKALTVNYGANPDFSANTTVKPSDSAALNMGMNANGFTGRIDLGTNANAVTINGTSHGLIRTIAEMQAIGSNLANSYVLASDLDFAGANLFKAIGFGTAYSGRFDGLGHQVKNLTSIETGGVGGNFGLFGSVSGVITNLGTGGTLNYQYLSSGGPKIGGLATNLQTAGILRNVYAAVNIYAYSSFNTPTAGGLVAMSTGSITNAFATGTVKTVGHGTGNTYAGGLVGQMLGGVISRSYATGAVSVGASLQGQAGGLVGNASSNSTIQNAYATGSVTSIDSNTQFDGLGTSVKGGNISLGGLVGNYSSSSTAAKLDINGAFATGKVSQTGQAPNLLRMGGLLGNVSNTVSILQNAYWDPTSTAQTSALATNSVQQLATNGAISAAIGTAGTTFPNLDSNIWGVSGGMPFLKAIPAAVTSSPIYISLNCGVLCNNTYGDNVTLNFGAFTATSGGTLLTDAALTGTATYNVFQGATLIGNSLNSLTDAGTYTITYTGGLTSGNASYVVNTGDAVTWTVNKRTLSVSLQATQANPLSKAYDGNASLALAAQSFLLGNFVGAQGAGATLTGVTSGSFNSKNVADASTVTASLVGGSLNLTAQGAKASNYQLPTANNGMVSAAGTITPKALTMVGTTVADKIYNGNQDAMVTLGVLNGLVTVNGVTEVLSTSATGTFTSRNASSDAQNVTVAYQLANGAQMQPEGKSQGLAGNYSLANEIKTAKITPKALGVTGLSAQNRVYNGNNMATVTGTAVVDTQGVIGNDQIAVTGTVTGGLFADKHVGLQKAVSITGLTLTGADKDNYQLSPTALKADITAKALSVTNLGAAGKTYDGKRDATVNASQAVFDGMVAGDTLGVTATGLFDTKDAGVNKDVAFTGITLTGQDAGNYSLTTIAASAKADITAKALTVTNTTVANKTYDGLTNAAVTVGTLNGLVEGETLGATTAVGTFADKDAGAEKNVTVAYTLVNGANAAHKASNYSLANETKAASIGKRALTIAGTTVANKTYDGLTNGAVTVGTLNGLVEGEALGTTTATGTFADKDAGDGKNVTVAYTLANGANAAHKASNYSLANETKQANIGKKALTVTGTNVANKIYDGLTNGVVTVGTLNGLVAGETLGTTTATGTFADKDAGDGKNVTVAYTLANGANAAHKASNYTLAGETKQANIGKRALTMIGATVANKTYDDLTNGVVTVGALNGLVEGETLGTTTATGMFAGKDVTFNKNGEVVAQNVTVAYTLANGANAAHKASNYSLANETKEASITQKSLTVTGTTVANKTYDGNTNGVVTVGTLNGLVEGETLGTTTGTGTFADKDAGDGKNVTVAYALANGANAAHKASNYSLANETKTANIGKKALTVANTTVANKTYDGLTNAAVTVGTLNGLVEGETLGITTAVGTFADKDAGDGKNVTVAYTLANGANAAHKASNYSLASETKTANIGKKALTVANTTVANKTYDGNTAATVTVGKVSGFVEGEVLGTTTATGTFADKDAGAEKNVTVAYTLANGANAAHKASNYSLANETKAASITQKALTIAGTTVANKTYDGNTNGVVTVGTLNGLVEGETLGTTTATGAFADKDAGDGKNVTVAYTLANGANAAHKASNYTLAGETKQANIAKRALTITGTTVANKTYDGLTNAAVTVGTLSGLVEGETLGTTTASGTFADKDAGEGKNVTVAYTLANGANAAHKASNYSLANETKQANIGKKALTIAGTTVANKTYDGTTNGVVTVGTLNGLVEGETLGATTATGTFADKDAGAEKNVTVAYTLANGAHAAHKASNYSLANETKAASIAQKALTIAGTTVANKTYDGNTNGVVTVGTLNGLVEGETLGTTTATGTFADKDAGDGKNVTVAYTLANGANAAHKASNYTLAGETKQANIAKRTLTMTGTTVANKTYDGLTNGAVTVGILSGLVEGETLGATTATGTFADKDAGDGKNVTVAYTLANGANAAHKASNYSLANETKQASIGKKALTIAGTTVANKTYDGLTNAAVTVGTLNGLVEGETLGATTATGTFADKDAGAEKNVTVAYTLANGANAAHKASNYSLANETKAASIAQKALTIAGTTVANKTYDGNTNGVVTVGTLNGLVEGETLGTTTATGTFADKDAGDGKNVTVAYTLANGANAAHKASNYTLAGETKQANIAKRTLTMTGTTVANKTYDGLTNAAVTLGTLGNLVAGETLGTTVVGTFADKDAGDGKNVAVTYTLANGENGKASNYSLANETKQANIAKRSLTVTGIAANGKTYDGNTIVTLSSQGTLNNLVEGESLVLSTTGAFDSANAGARKVNTTSTLANGVRGLISNYTLSNVGNVVDATVTPRSGVTVTANSQSKLVGAADPALSFLSSGLLAGDVLSGALSRAPGEAAGLYAISLGSVGNPNYVISRFDPALLTITSPVSDTAVTHVQVRLHEGRLTVSTPTSQPTTPTSEVNTFFVPANTFTTQDPGRLVVLSGGVRLPTSSVTSEQ